MKKLQGKVTLVTGATSGIGEACARYFAEAGSDLILLARRSDRLAAVAERLQKDYGVDTLTICCDVRDYEGVKRQLEVLAGRWKDIDILVNNAGLARGLTKIQEGVLEDWEDMIDTNIKGLLYVSRCILPGMVEKNEGTVINIGSIAGREAYPMGNVYCGTKHAVKAISRGMVFDLNGTAIRVINIDPGLVETEFSEVRFRGDKERAETVYKGYKPLTGDDIADIALYAATRPPHVLIQDIMVTPVAQASTMLTHKEAPGN